ncbi:hypothetical protein C8R46DRAFT_1206928 [Mycena filopes]|nr:hypothetical protein C8R46DRAFT_1206928 [Mycena filopes]
MYEYDIHGDTIMRDVQDLETPRSPQTSLVAAPIRRLPQDLLYELFMTITGKPSLESCDIAVRLSHVCCDWRAILLHSPLFWKFVAMHGARSRRDHSLTVDSFLRRSQDQLITVALFLRKTPCPVSEFSRTLQHHAPRIRSLRVFTSDVETLSSHLRHLSAISFPSLQDHKAVLQSYRPGTFTAVACYSEPKNADTQMLLLTGVPTWPPHLHVTTLSFTYSSFKFIDIFLILSMTRTTLEHLKLYSNAQMPSYLQDIAGSPIELPKLRSLALGFQDPFSPLPFLWRARFPTLDTVSIEDIRSPTQKREPSNTPLQQLFQNVEPMTALVAVLLQVIPVPTLTSLRLVGLAYPASAPASGIAAAVNIFVLLGPQLRTLDLADCGPGFLIGLAAAMCTNDPREWGLESLSVRGMDCEAAVRCLRIREKEGHPKLKELVLAPYTLSLALEQFAEVVKGT